MDERRLKALIALTAAAALAVMGGVTFWMLGAHGRDYDEVGAAYVERFATDMLSGEAGMFEELARDELDALAAEAAFLAADPALADLAAKTAESARHRPDLGLWLRTALQTLGVDFVTVVGPDGKTLARGSHWREFGDDVFTRDYPVGADPIEAPSNLQHHTQQALAGRAVSAFEVIPAPVLALERALVRGEGAGGATGSLAAEALGADEGPRGADVGRGLAMLSMQPVADAQGRVVGALAVGRVLNRDARLIERFTRVTGREGALYLYGEVIDASAGATNPSLAPGAAMPPGVREDVFRRELSWLGVTADGDRRFYTAIRPLKNAAGAPVAAVAVSFPGERIEALLAEQRAQAGSLFWTYVAIWAGAALVVLAVATWIASTFAAGLVQRRRMQLAEFDRQSRAQPSAPAAKREPPPSEGRAAPAPAAVTAPPAPRGVLDFQELHRRLDERLARAARSGASLAFLLIGVDQYPLWLDRGGAGAIRALFEELRALVEEAAGGEPVVGTFREDQLLAVVPGVGAREAFETGERIRQAAASRRFAAAAETERLTLSIGVSTFGKDERATKAQLLLDAEDALRDARKAGGNTTAVRRPRREVV